jgi:hypothetical protein
MATACNRRRIQGSEQKVTNRNISRQTVTLCGAYHYAVFDFADRVHIWYCSLVII